MFAKGQGIISTVIFCARSQNTIFAHKARTCNHHITFWCNNGEVVASVAVNSQYTTYADDARIGWKMYECNCVRASRLRNFIDAEAPLAPGNCLPCVTDVWILLWCSWNWNQCAIQRFVRACGICVTEVCVCREFYCSCSCFVSDRTRAFAQSKSRTSIQTNNNWLDFSYKQRIANVVYVLSVCLSVVVCNTRDSIRYATTTHSFVLFMWKLWLRRVHARKSNRSVNSQRIPHIVLAKTMLPINTNTCS